MKTKNFYIHPIWNIPVISVPLSVGPVQMETVICNSCSLVLVRGERLAQLLRALVCIFIPITMLLIPIYSIFLPKPTLAYLKPCLSTHLALLPVITWRNHHVLKSVLRLRHILTAKIGGGAHSFVWWLCQMYLTCQVHSFYPETDHVGVSIYYFHLKSAF